MSTNYYFKVKYELKINNELGLESVLQKEIYEDLQEKLSEISLIHIGKRSMGWVPLFQKQKYFSSVQEIKDFYFKHKDELKIVNSYDDELTFEELEQELFNWNKYNEQAKNHIDAMKDNESYEFVDYHFS